MWKPCWEDFKRQQEELDKRMYRMLKDKGVVVFQEKRDGES